MMLDSSAFFDMEVGKKQPRPELKENEVLKLDEIARHCFEGNETSNLGQK